MKAKKGQYEELKGKAVHRIDDQLELKATT